MRSSILVTVGAAALTMGSPLQKRKMETSWVMEYQTVTVTGSETPKPTIFFGGQKHSPETTASYPVVVVTETPEAPAPPAPTTSVPQPSVVIVTESAPAPQPTTEEPAKQAPPPSTSSTSSEAPVQTPTGDDYPTLAVQHHNIHRSNHSAPDVTYNATLAQWAANTAATCIMAHDMDQGTKGYGQNLANFGLSSGAEKLGEGNALKMAITNAWYDGEFNKFPDTFYGLATPPMEDFESWGHITQLLWKGSDQVGCATQWCPRGTMYSGFDTWFTVCNYGPQGNVGGAYGTNVLPPLGKSVVSV